MVNDVFYFFKTTSNYSLHICKKYIFKHVFTLFFTFRSNEYLPIYCLKTHPSKLKPFIYSEKILVSSYTTTVSLKEIGEVLCEIYFPIIFVLCLLYRL